MTVYRPDPGAANGAGVIVCPGGGWSILAWRHEGIDVAAWFAERGYTAFLLKYRLSATPEDPAIYGGETRGRPVPADAPPLFTVIAHDDL